MMSKPVYFNGREIFPLFKASLLDYRVGPPEISNSYLSWKNNIIPVKLNEAIGVRPLKIDLEFEGENPHEALLNISDMTAELLHETDILMPDGFYYFSILKSVSEPKLKGNSYYTVTFELVCYRHGAMVSKEFSSSGSIDVLGNHKAPAIITIENAAGTVTVNDITVRNVNHKVIINGFDKTVFETDDVVTSNKFKDCDMTTFPALNPGVNMIEISGAGKVTIEYQPIYL